MRRVALGRDVDPNGLGDLWAGGLQVPEGPLDEVLGTFRIRGEQRHQLHLLVCRELLRRREASEHALDGQRVEMTAPESVDARGGGAEGDAHRGKGEASAQPRHVGAAMHPHPPGPGGGEHRERAVPDSSGDLVGHAVQSAQFGARIFAPDDRSGVPAGEPVAELLLGALAGDRRTVKQQADDLPALSMGALRQRFALA